MKSPCKPLAGSGLISDIPVLPALTISFICPVSKVLCFFATCNSPNPNSSLPHEEVKQTRGFVLWHVPQQGRYALELGTKLWE